MADADEQPAYVIIQREYEGILRASHETRMQAVQLNAHRTICELQEAHAEELVRRDHELAIAKAEQGRLKRENLSWRRKSVRYQSMLASAEESAQHAKNLLASNTAVLLELTEGREVLLSANKALQEQVQALTELVQWQHRAKAAQQGQLNTTDAEAKELQTKLMHTYELSETFARQIADARAAHEAARVEVKALQQQLAKGQVQLQAQAAAHAGLQAECEKLRASVAEEVAARSERDAQIAALTAEIQQRVADLTSAEQRLAQAKHDSGLREEQRVQELQRLRVADGVIIQELQLDVERLKERLTQGRRDAEQEHKLLQAKLEREVALREALERESAERSKQLREAEDNHGTALAQLRRQLTDKAAELQHATDMARRLEERLDASEKRVSTRIQQIAELEAALERSSQNLCQHVSRKDAAVRALQEQLEQERRKLEQKEAELREVQDAHARRVGQLERRMAQLDAAGREQEAQLQQQAENARHLQHQADVAKRQAGHAEKEMQERLKELQTALEARDERIKELTGGHEADAAQYDRRLRQLQASHAAEVARLEARSRELEQQLTVLPERITELQASLAAREARIKHLMEAQAADTVQHERRQRQLQGGHAAEVARLEARIRELEHQLTVMPSPAEPQRNQVCFAAATVDKLMGNLLGGGLGVASLRAMDEDDDDDDNCGPSADLILGMSQPHLSKGIGDVPMLQHPAAAAAPSAPRHVPEPPAAAPDTAAAGGWGIDMAASDGAAKDAEPGKRGPEPSGGGSERPAGRGRGRKAAKHSKEQHAAVGSADPGRVAAMEDEEPEPSEEPPPDVGLAARAGSRRRAAQAGQARVKSMAAALADDSDADSMAVDTPGFEVKGTRTRRAVRAAVQAAAAAAAVSSAASVKETTSFGLAVSEGTEMSLPAPEATAAETKRGRAGARRGKGPARPKVGQPEEAQHVAEKAVAPPQPVAHAAEPKQPAPGRDAAAMMQSPGKAAAGLHGGAAAGKPQSHEVEAVPTTQEFEFAASQPPTQQVASQPPTQQIASQPPTQQVASQPPTQPQPRPGPAPPLAAAAGSQQVKAGAAPGALPKVSQQVLPTVSTSSIFSQSLLGFDAGMAKNPLAVLNPRLLEQAKNKRRIVPFTAIQQFTVAQPWKLQPPSICKPAEGAAAKRPLPPLKQGDIAGSGASVVPGNALPPDMLLRTLQPLPNKAGAKGG